MLDRIGLSTKFSDIVISFGCMVCCLMVEYDGEFDLVATKCVCVCVCGCRGS